MLSEADETARFFELFEQALRAPRRREGRDDRAYPREAFPTVQLIAPKHGLQMPPRSEFQTVRCFDLSAAGFSFLTPTPPAYEELFVVLGTEPHLKFLSARVAHQTRLTLVGCSFTGRAQP